MYKINIYKVFFYYTTWGYVITNFLVAWITSLSLVFMILRDFWVFIFIFLLIKTKNFFPVILILIMLIYGIVGILEYFDVNIIFSIFYGFRDIILIVLIVELLKIKDSFNISKNEINIFVNFVVLIAFVHIIISTFFNSNIVNEIFNMSNYYNNKGIDINLSNGFFGQDRTSVPLYSPNLLCTLIVTYYFLQKDIPQKIYLKFIALIVAFFTLSKVLVIGLFFYFFNRSWKYILTIVILVSIPMYFVLIEYYNNLEMGLLKYHLASTIGHLNAFQISIETGLTTFIPDILGSNSIASKVLSGNNEAGIESTLLARFADYKIYFLILLIYVIYNFRYLISNVEKKTYVFIFIILLLTATSNHPVVYVPFIYLLNFIKRKNGSHI